MQKRDATIVYDLGQILEMDADLTPCKGTTNVKLNDSSSLWLEFVDLCVRMILIRPRFDADFSWGWEGLDPRLVSDDNSGIWEVWFLFKNAYRGDIALGSLLRSTF